MICPKGKKEIHYDKITPETELMPYRIDALSSIVTQSKICVKTIKTIQNLPDFRSNQSQTQS